MGTLAERQAEKLLVPTFTLSQKIAFYFASHFSCLPVTNIEESYHAIAIPGENLISDASCDGAVSLLVIVQSMTIQVRIGTKLFRKLRAFPFSTILNP